MILLCESALIESINDPNIRCLVERRFNQLGASDGQMIVVEPGDSVEALEKSSGCPILRDLFDECRFPDDGFAPAFEVLEDHGCCYEMVFIFTDNGSGVELFIPKREGVDPQLLAMCAQYAVPV
jgi:hypothetical protein